MKIKLPGGNKNKKRHAEAGDYNMIDFTASSGTASGAASTQPAAFALTDAAEDSFSVNVRNAEPLIRRPSEERPVLSWLGGLQVNLSCAVILTAIFTMLLSAAYLPEMIPFALPGMAVFLLLTSLEAFGRDRIRMYTAAVIAVLLIAALIVFRKYIGGGWALIMDQFYDSAEEAQAYIYQRFDAGSMGDEHPYRSMHIALLWGSALAGLLTALPHFSARRNVSYVLAVFAMIAFAYYGIIPAGACIALLAAAVVFVMARGHIAAVVPVFVLVMLVFGAVMLIDPGESYGVSRMDENFRDRFALLSAYLERDEADLDDLSGLEDSDQDIDQSQDDQDQDSMIENRGIITAAVIIAVIAAFAAAAWIAYRGLRKRQAANRAGIDSNDPREAVVAMFPYAVRWLQPAGIDVEGKDFASLVPVVRSDVSGPYADSYEGMYEKWQEAAYSDHEVTEDTRHQMKAFVDETAELSRREAGLRTRIINTFKYAL